MLVRLRLITITLGASIALFLMLCLGAQNLSDRHSLKIGNATTAPLPSGFIIGTSIILGVITGGTTTALIIAPDET